MLTNSNSKLGISVYNFNLPRTTCEKFRSSYCDRYCYAKHGAWTFPSTVRKMEYNLWASKSPDFVRWVCEEIKRKKIKWIRLHSSGDFYNWGYVRNWIKIARKNPKVRFLAFTRDQSLHQRFFPKNFTLYQSYDGMMITNHLSAFLILPKKPISEYRHMEMYGNDRICRSKCKNCRACWYGKFNIVFLQRWQNGKYDERGMKMKPNLRQFREKMERK